MIGVVGGGQLAMLLVEAGEKRDVDVVVQTAAKTDPAAKKTNQVILSEPTNPVGTKLLAEKSRLITFENEWVDISSLLSLENSGVSFVPRLQSIRPLINKITQRELLNSLDIHCPDWLPIPLEKPLGIDLPADWGFPLMAKAAKGGYDGKGNKKIKTKEDLDSFLTENNSDEWLIEEWIEYEKELALVGSRDRTGKIRFFPIVETFQSNHVCDWVLVPGTNEYDLNLFAINIFSSIVNELNYVGVLAIEFFYGDYGLLINEIAPRTHNSAHFSIEACSSSQFDQYVCISSGILPPEIKMNCEGAIMINLLGLKKNFPISMETRIKMLSEIEGSNIHCYGKSREILGRKMAHITFLLNGKTYSERYDEAQVLLTMVRDIWPSPNT